MIGFVVHVQTVNEHNCINPSKKCKVGKEDTLLLMFLQQSNSFLTKSSLEIFKLNVTENIRREADTDCGYKADKLCLPHEMNEHKTTANTGGAAASS